MAQKKAKLTTKAQIDKIVHEAKNILTQYAIDDNRITTAICEQVFETFIKALNKKQQLRFNDDDVLSIADLLRVNDNSRSYATWRRWDTYNYLVMLLGADKLFWSPLINIPKRIRPFLVLDATNSNVKNMSKIQSIQDYLFSFPIFTGARTTIKSGKRVWDTELIEMQEAEYLCSFLAAAGIFGKILFDDYHRWILTIDKKDIDLKLGYINRTETNSSAFQRYVLPFPATLYLVRCVLFYQKNLKRLNRNSPDLQNKLFPVTTDLLNKIPELFKKWTVNIFQEPHNGSSGLGISDFRKAAIAGASINHCPEHSRYNNIPPFITAIQSGQMRSYSYGNRHFAYFFNETAAINDYRDLAQTNLQTDHVNMFQRQTITQKIMRKFTTVRRKLNKKNMNYIVKRQAIIEELDRLYKTLAAIVSQNSARNLVLYVNWLKHTIMNRNLRHASINTYAGMAQKILLSAEDDNALEDLTLTELELTICQTMYEYSSKNIRSALKDFSDYLADEKVGAFPALNWNSKKLDKSNVPTTKSFIQIEEFETILNKATYFYMPFRLRITKNKLTGKKISAAVHKAELIRMICYLGYYGGLRISEIMKLRCRHIKFNGGYYITILKTKTINGKRNIPIGLLFPSAVRAEFINYYLTRQKSGGHDALLFVGRSGKGLSSSRMSREAARLFTWMGIKNFRFHFLRHCFVNIFALRWLTAFHADKIPKDARFLKHQLFDQQHLDNIRYLTLGMGAQRIGSNLSVNLLQTLSRLVGHGSPTTTVSEYFHISDVLHRIFSKHYEKIDIELTVRQVMDFLQTDHSKIPSEFYKRAKKKLLLVNKSNNKTKLQAALFLEHQRSFVSLETKPVQSAP